MELFIYERSEPIDFFQGAIPFGQYLLQIQCEHPCQKESKALTSEAIKRLVEAISRLARAFRKWEGDVRDEVYVFGLPTEDYMLEVGYIIKQDTSGTTFIVSPKPLDWLVTKADKPHLWGHPR